MNILLLTYHGLKSIFKCDNIYNIARTNYSRLVFVIPLWHLCQHYLASRSFPTKHFLVHLAFFAETLSPLRYERKVSQRVTEIIAKKTKVTKDALPKWLLVTY